MSRALSPAEPASSNHTYRKRFRSGVDHGPLDRRHPGRGGETRFMAEITTNSGIACGDLSVASDCVVLKWVVRDR